MIRILLQRTLRTVAGIVLLIAAIFIAESFTTLMSKVIENDGSALRLALLLLLKLPEIVDFALPLALVLGIYFAITGARDDNELIVCATAGGKWTDIPLFATQTGFVGLCISLLFVGFFTPMSAYLMRVQQYQMEAQAIIGQVNATGQKNFNRTIDDRAVVVTPSDDPDSKRGNLYVFQMNEDESWRFSQADDWALVAPDGNDGVKVRLTGYREFTGAPVKMSPDVQTEIDAQLWHFAQARPSDVDLEFASDIQLMTFDSVRLGQNILAFDLPRLLEASRSTNAELGNAALMFDSARIRTSNLKLDFKIEPLLPTFDPTRYGQEVLFFALPNIGASFVDPSRKFAEALARAMFCLIAAVLAVAGAAWAGTRMGRFAALPVTVVAALGFDIVARAMMGDAAEKGAMAFWMTTGTVSAIALIIPLTYIFMRGEMIVLPARNRG